jgi:hypothetical protein
MNTLNHGTYSASLDKTSIIITTCIAILFSGLLYFNLSKLQEASTQPGILIGLILSSLLMLIIFVGSYLYRITGYELTPSELIIHRPVSDKVISLNTIQKVEVAEKEKMKYTIRTFGNGGLFGYFGKFSNDHYGPMHWFVSQRKNYLALHLKNQKIYMLSPDDLSLCKDLNKRLNA